MIKITYQTISSKANKPEETTIRIFDGKYFASYNIAGKAESTVKKMREDGRKGVLYSRGMMIQIFPNKNEEEICEIVKADIQNGIMVAEKKTNEQIKIENLVITKQ